MVKWTASNVSLDSDAVFISCTNLKMFRALRAIEERTGKPVVSSNSATLWNVLQRLKLQVSLPHLGKLLT
ncbi:MAG: hypothetical protein NZ733_01675 [Aigarchaeota archaeon]|nr:hypothetical protein [Aigarchaeota archaeon]